MANALTRRRVFPIVILVASMLADRAIGSFGSMGSSGLVRLTKDDGEYVGVQRSLVLAAHVSPSTLDSQPLTRIHLHGHAPIDVKDPLTEVASKLGLGTCFGISGDATSLVNDSIVWVNVYAIATFCASTYRRTDSPYPMTDLVFNSGLRLTVLDPPRSVAQSLGV